MGGKIARSAVILIVALAVGFAFGRYGLGEGYLKKSITQIERPTVKPVPQADESAPEPLPLIIPEIPPPPEAPEEEPEEEEETAEGSEQESVETSESKPPTEEKPKPTPPQTTAAPEPRFALQAGSFENILSARQVAAGMERKGFPAKVRPFSQAGITTFRVILGPYEDEETARAKAAELKEKGVEVFVFQDK